MFEVLPENNCFSNGTRIAPGKPLVEWRKILTGFSAATKKSNEVVAFLQKEHGVPRYWARTVTTWYLKQQA